MRVQVKDVADNRGHYIEIYADDKFLDCFCYDPKIKGTRFYALRRCHKALDKISIVKSTKTIRDYVI